MGGGGMALTQSHTFYTQFCNFKFTVTENRCLLVIDIETVKHAKYVSYNIYALISETKDY